MNGKDHKQESPSLRVSSETLVIVLLYGRRYQINAKTELALRYDNVSPLENHHYAVAVQILGYTENNIFCNVNQHKQRYIHDVRPTQTVSVSISIILYYALLLFEMLIKYDDLSN